MPPIAVIKPYDDSNYPRLIITPIKTFVYFQLTYETSAIKSIWDTDQNIDFLFKQELLNYFDIQRKVIYGRFDIEYLFRTGKLQKSD
jgi:hypothetical protein